MDALGFNWNDLFREHFYFSFRPVLQRTTEILHIRFRIHSNSKTTGFPQHATIVSKKKKKNIVQSDKRLIKLGN